MAVLNLETYLHDIEELCIQHKVKHLYAFGSVLTDRFNLKSDVDLMVDFEPIEVEQYADNYYSLKFSLEDILNRPVDLLEEKAVKNPYFKELLMPNASLFMDIEIKSCLFDALKAIDEIDRFFIDQLKNFIVF